MENKTEYNYFILNAHRKIQKIIQNGEELNIRFFVDKFNLVCIWATSVSYPEKFKVVLTYSLHHLIISYMEKGEYREIEQTSKNFMTYFEKKDYQFEIIKKIISCIKPNLVPVLRDTNRRISGFFSLKYGKIYLNIKQTEEVFDFLRENNIIL